MHWNVQYIWWPHCTGMYAMVIREIQNVFSFSSLQNWTYFGSLYSHLLIGYYELQYSIHFLDEPNCSSTAWICSTKKCLTSLIVFIRRLSEANFAWFIFLVGRHSSHSSSSYSVGYNRELHCSKFLFFSLISLTLTVFFLLTLSCWFMLRPCYCIQRGPGGALIGATMFSIPCKN